MRSTWTGGKDIVLSELSILLLNVVKSWCLLGDEQMRSAWTDCRDIALLLPFAYPFQNISEFF